jgi:hypothetical protein
VAAGARVVYLPPYSLDLNPIELVFSKFKWLFTSASARTVEALWPVCGDVLDRFTETECRNCFQHCGYRYTKIGRALAAMRSVFPSRATCGWSRPPRNMWAGSRSHPSGCTGRRLTKTFRSRASWRAVTVSGDQVTPFDSGSSGCLTVPRQQANPTPRHPPAITPRRRGAPRPASGRSQRP